MFLTFLFVSTKEYFEFSLDVSAIKPTLDDFGRCLIPFLLHIESYLVKKKGH